MGRKPTKAEKKVPTTGDLIHDNLCIHQEYDKEARTLTAPCGEPVPSDAPHGWTCARHQ